MPPVELKKACAAILSVAVLSQSSATLSAFKFAAVLQLKIVPQLFFYDLLLYTGLVFYVVIQTGPGSHIVSILRAFHK
jgi:hypothetical protein